MNREACSAQYSRIVSKRANGETLQVSKYGPVISRFRIPSCEIYICEMCSFWDYRTQASPEDPPFVNVFNQLNKTLRLITECVTFFFAF